MGAATLEKEEHWLCRRRRAREIVGCDKPTFERLMPFLPYLELPTAQLFVVEYLEALAKFASGRRLTTEVTKMGASLPLFAQSREAQYLMCEAEKLVASTLRGQFLSIEVVSAYLNLAPEEVMSWRRRGFFVREDKQLVDGRRFRAVCKWRRPINR